MTGERLITRCPAGCDAELLSSGIALPEGSLLRCAACGQLVSQCSVEQYESALRKWDTAGGTTPSRDAIARHDQVGRRRLRTLLALLGRGPAGVRLLDVGCSSGAFLETARQAGLDAEGVELSPEAAQTARRAGFRVFTGRLEDARFPDAVFDAIALIELVEHLPDPRALLEEGRRILRPGGIVMITTPNGASLTARAMGARWGVFSLTGMGGHVSFFNPRSLRMLAERTGFEVAKLETRHVRLAEKGQHSKPLYALAKLAAGLLDAPARFANAGHDFTAYFRALPARGRARPGSAAIED
jgi:2-polyprenyl-3-methyl-5-hydroxy-6-metoxy-1,4-benzoquinol methylase